MFFVFGQQREDYYWSGVDGRLFKVLPASVGRSRAISRARLVLQSGSSKIVWRFVALRVRPSA